MSTAAILVAGGASTRVQHAENKVYLPVAGRPLVAWSLAGLASSPLIDVIVLVIRAGDAERAQAVLAAEPIDKLVAVVEGGATRQASELAGLQALSEVIESGGVELVCIHDAARPFVSQDLLARVLRTARERGGALPGLPLEYDLLLRMAAGGDAETVPTADLRRVQTPQAFRARPLLAAYRAARKADFHGVDTATSVEHFGDLDVRVVPGDPRNVKVTFAQDLVTVEELAARWEREEGNHPRASSTSRSTWTA